MALSASAFLPLERQARRLQLLAACSVGLVAIVPALVFCLLAVRDLRSEAERHARHLAPSIASLAGGPRADVESLARQIKDEMVMNDLSSVRLLDAQGREVLRVGDPRGGLGAAEASVRLAAPGGLVRAIRVEADDRGLRRRAAWVVGIHLVVASLLALVVYRLPMRALWGAIDEVKRVQAQLVHSEKLAAIGEMYAGLAHEINNPLGIILTRVRLMLDAAEESQFPGELIRDLQVIERHGLRIAEIARSLLTFARASDLPLVATNVNGVIAELVALVGDPFAKQGIRIHARLADPLPHVRASAGHLQQALLNILTNARDAMPAGGTITLRTYVDGRTLVIAIRDTGDGIPAELQGRVFEPFFTTKEVGKGTGLGLSVSYGIVRAHGGNITIDSSPGQGATFRVLLPIERTRR